MSDDGFKSYVSGYVAKFKLSEEERRAQKARSGLTRFLTWAGFNGVKEGAIDYCVQVEVPVSGNPIHKDAKHFPSGIKNTEKANTNTTNNAFTRASLVKGHGRS